MTDFCLIHMYNIRMGGSGLTDYCLIHMYGIRKGESEFTDYCLFLVILAEFGAFSRGNSGGTTIVQVSKR